MTSTIESSSHKNAIKDCPCGSKKKFTACCELIHQQHSLATQAEQLMRARYSAFVTGNNDFIIKTYHSSNRPKEESGDIENIKNSTLLTWCKLEIVSTSTSSDIAFVEFKAWFIEDKKLQVMHENSRFLKESSSEKSDTGLCWYYVDGEFIDDHKTTKKTELDNSSNNSVKSNSTKIARNSPCPCGSGKKHKRCCA